ncbi:hypothetical protein CRG98_006627 [Punica granatum]|uniref:Aminotransferase-like plant mobile domain-containing protein n=1 Tax=Punica granatum TaxID=22663 RepID=A0A2I0KWT5_PUNGR|nr:hypothetical protein CRG98_006627 [Punica granatum]
MASGDSTGHSQAALHRLRVCVPRRDEIRDYITTFVRDVPILSARRVDWNFLGATVTFWDPTHAVFNIQGTELAPTIEEYRTLIGRTTVTHADRRLRGSPILLQIWLQGHANPFGLVRPVLFFSRSGSIISQLLSLIRVEERKISEWIKIFREIPPRGFKWRAAWMPPGPAALRCPEFNGVPLDFQATEEYVLCFYRWGPTTHEDSADSPRTEDSGPTRASLTPNMAIQAELANLRAERDHLRREVAEKDEQLVDQRQLQRELAQAGAELQRHEQELARANVALERPTVDPNLWVPPTHTPEDIEAPAIHAPAGLPANVPPPSVTLSATIPLPSSNPTTLVPPPMSIPVPAPIYATPPPMVFSAQSPHALAHTSEPLPFQVPQPHISFSYPTLPPLNIPIPEPGMPTQAVPIAPPTNFLPETGTEQEQRLKKMEENIKALQSGGSRLDAGDGDWSLFPGMRLPPKIKVPEFQSEAQQIQLFHSTLKGAYYLHLLAHTSSFSNLIDAGKKLDIGVKLGKIEGPAEKKEGESSVRTRMWTLVGARIARFWIARLGSVHLLVGTRDGHA